MCGVPGADAGYPLGYPLLEISATDLARRTVVAPEMIDGGTEEGPIESAEWCPMPYNAASGIAACCKIIDNVLEFKTSF